MPNIIEWHPQLTCATMNIHLANVSQQSNSTLSGYTQVASNISARWHIDIDLTNTAYEKLHHVRAMVMALRGQENLLRLPVPAAYFCSKLAADYAPIPFDDGAYLNDFGGFSDGARGIGSVTLAKGANVLTADLSAYGHPIRPGMMFGIERHLYMAVSVVNDVITFEPSARADYTAEPIRPAPTVLCRLAESQGGSFATPANRIAAPSLSLREDII